MPSLRHYLFLYLLKAVNFRALMARDIRTQTVRKTRPSKRQRRRLDIGETQFEGHSIWHFNPPQRPHTPNPINPPVLYYLHGGAFVYGMLSVHFKTLSHLARLSGYHIIAPEYPLTPQACGADIQAFTHRHFEHVLQNAPQDGPECPVVMMGDSAGGGLALSILQTRIARAQPCPSELILWSPWVDVSMNNPDCKRPHPGEALIGYAGLRRAGIRYAAPHDPMTSTYSPLHGNMAGLPHITVFTGGQDILHHDILKFCSALGAQDKDKVRCITEPGLGHYWMFMPQKEASVTLRQTANILAAL